MLKLSNVKVDIQGSRILNGISLSSRRVNLSALLAETVPEKPRHSAALWGTAVRYPARSRSMVLI